MNAERYIPPERKEYENKIFGAQERSIGLEQEIFAEIRRQAVAHLETIQLNALAIAQLDVLAAFAEASDIETGRQQARAKADGESCEVRDHVGAPAANTGKGEQCDATKDWCEAPAQTTSSEVATPPDEGGTQGEC